MLFNLEYLLLKIIHPRKKICIIRHHWKAVGLFCYFNQTLGGIAYAERRNMIPVIDIRTNINSLLYENEKGRVNAWEYYFEQPSGITLDETLSMNDAVIKNAHENISPSQSADFFMNDWGQLDYWKKICRKYIRLSPAAIEKFEAMKAKYEGRKILGVIVRGTDFVTTRPSGHPIPPTAEQAIKKAREAMREKNFDSVYLATEDKRILAKFQDAFGEKLILPDAQYVDYDYSNTGNTGKDRNWMYKYHNDRENDKYLSGMEYLVSILFLSRCEGFIASGNNGAVGAMLFSEGFKYFYFFDLGTFDKPKLKP